MAKRDTTNEPLTSLQAAMTAVDNGENPLQSDGNDFVPNISEVLLARAADEDDLRTAPPGSKRASSWDGMGLDAYGFGTIPATDHDRLSAEVDQITTTRASTHGRYRDTARIAQSFKRVVHMELDDRLARGQPDLTDQQLESIDLICTKLARIISGDSNEPDHWKDIGGYAQIALVDK
jgi:hypothetical protein